MSKAVQDLCPFGHIIKPRLRRYLGVLLRFGPVSAAPLRYRIEASVLPKRIDFLEDGQL